MVALRTSPCAARKRIKKGKNPCCHFVAAGCLYPHARQLLKRLLFAIFLLLPQDLMDQESNTFGVRVRQGRGHVAKTPGLDEVHDAPPRATAGTPGGDIRKQKSAERAE